MGEAHRFCLKTLKKGGVALTCLLSLLGFSTACEPEEHDQVTTSARVTLAAPDSIALLQVKGTVTIQCLTNRLTWTTDEWDSISVCFPKVMTGPYSLSADGKIAVKINQGRRKVYRFRANNNYVEMLDHPSNVKLDILLIQ